MTSKARLQKVIDWTGLSPAAFAQKVRPGVRPQWIYDILNEKVTSTNKVVNISKNVVDAILSTYPELSKSFLLTGDGEMLTRHSSVKLDHWRLRNTDPVNDLGEYIIVAPYISSNEISAYLAKWGDKEYLNTLPTIECLISGRQESDYFLFTMDGDNMDNGTKDSICSGDRILCERLSRSLWEGQELNFEEYSPDFLVHHASKGLAIYRISNYDIKKGILTGSSLNSNKKKYPEIKMTTSEISQLFNVVQVIREKQ